MVCVVLIFFVCHFCTQGWMRGGGLEFISVWPTLIMNDPNQCFNDDIVSTFTRVQVQT